MKIIKKNVYYCDHCKKKGLSAGAMKSHEKHCTGNPKRECAMCDNVEVKDIPKVISEFKQRFKIEPKPYDESFQAEKIIWLSKEEKEITLDEIREQAKGCPNCILTIIRGIGLKYLHDFEFDHQKEIERWWTEKNEMQQNEEYQL